MNRAERIAHLNELMDKYKYHFELKGPPDSGYNMIRLACFINKESPTQYEAFYVNKNKTIIFFNTK